MGDKTPGDGRPSIRKQWANLFEKDAGRYQGTRDDLAQAEAAYSAGRLAEAESGIKNTAKITTLLLKMELAEENADRARKALVQSSESFADVEREALIPAAAADSGTKLTPATPPCSS